MVKDVIEAKNGYIFCVITYNIKNISEEMIDISSDLKVSPFRLKYEGENYLSDISQLNIKPNEIRYSAIKNNDESVYISLHSMNNPPINKKCEWIQKKKEALFNGYLIQAGDNDIWMRTEYNTSKDDEMYYLYPLETKEVREYIEIPMDMYLKYKDSFQVSKYFIKNMKYRGGDMDDDAYEKIVWDIENKENYNE